ncbi:MAG: tetratricopeptide repeat protein [Flavobacteriales bacterium]|nr:tetratricopeptide repeat protein [Flavobacteriales bacterium]
MGNKRAEAIGYNNIGVIYEGWKDYPKTLEYYKSSLAIFEEINSVHLAAITLSNIGGVYSYMGQYKRAAENMHRGLAKADSVKHLNYQQLICANLSEVYEKMGDYQQSLLYYKQSSIHKDSLFNEDKSKSIGKLETKYEFEKAEVERKRVKDEALAAQTSRTQRRNNLQYSGILIFLILSFAGIFTLGKFSIPMQLAEGMIFFSFLLLFEFTLVLLDPYIEAYSGGAPAVTLGFNAILAAMIFPLHVFFEERVKQRIVR